MSIDWQHPCGPGDGYGGQWVTSVSPVAFMASPSLNTDQAMLGAWGILTRTGFRN